MTVQDWPSRIEVQKVDEFVLLDRVQTRCAKWMMWACGMSWEQLCDLELDTRQLEIIGQALADNKLLNPPKVERIKRATFVCHCGCGESFVAEYKTKHPKYKNDAHKRRAYRQRVERKARIKINGR